MAHRNSTPSNSSMGLIGDISSLTNAAAGFLNIDYLIGGTTRRSDLTNTCDNTIEAQSNVAHKMDRKTYKIDRIDELQTNINMLMAENNSYKDIYTNGMYPKSIAIIINNNNSNIKQMKLEREQILKETKIL